MKPFPVKVVLDQEIDYFQVTWKIHNICTYDCSFCEPTYKNGDQRWLTLDEYKLMVDKLLVAAGNKRLWISFTGGEPTLCPHFVELAQYIKSKNCYLSLLSNGTRTIRWWKELRDAGVLDVLTITVHPEQNADPEHISELLNLFLDEPTKTYCWITSTKDTVKQAIDAHIYLCKTTGAEVLVKAMFITGYDLNNYIDPAYQLYIKHRAGARGLLYNKKKLANVPPAPNTIRIYMNDGSSETVTTENAVRNDMHYFEGWECYVGEFQAFIDYYKMHRGSCFLNTDQYINLLTDDVSFWTTPVTCERPTCLCGADIISTKIKN